MRQGLLLAFTSLFAAAPRGLPAQNGQQAAMQAKGAVVTLPDLLPLLAVTADMRRRWWVLVEKPFYKDILEPFPQRTARQRWVLAFVCTALKAGLPLSDDPDRPGWRSLHNPVIWACDAANWRAMGGHPDALRRNKHGGLRAAVQDQLISRWRTMDTVWAAPDGRYICAYGYGCSSPVLIAEMTGGPEATS